MEPNFFWSLLQIGLISSLKSKPNERKVLQTLLCPKATRQFHKANILLLGDDDQNLFTCFSCSPIHQEKGLVCYKWLQAI
jgi:hypothetical protein